MVAAIEAYFVTLRDAGCFPDDPVALTYEDGNGLFYSGEALLHTTGSWLAGDIEEAMPDSEIGFVPFPAIDGGTGRVWVSGVGSAWYITSNADHPDEAAAFVDHLFSQESAEMWIGGSRYLVPVDVDLSNVDLGPLFGSIIESVRNAEAEGVQFGYNIGVFVPAEFNEAMDSGFQGVLVGDKTAEEQAADLQAAWEEGTAGD